MSTTITKLTAIAAVVVLASCSRPASIPFGKTVSMDEQTMMDKIRGGWFAQTIGCTYGGPTEFKFKGGLMQDEQPLEWYDSYIYDTFIEDPGLYDDVYMDLTFLEVMSNILNGRLAPESGYWKYNPHADDIDFQIEADFIGMLTPGRPNDAAEIADGIGHIMNYGDGWYGGVYVSALYALAYVCDDIPTLVSEALKVIPEGTKFRNAIECVIENHAKYPSDWKRCWFEVDKKHSFDVGCPEGVWNGFNIDAVINAAYVVIGLLYGEGDFEKTMEISTRCGQDSDCNPASAAGILGVMYGYNAIPEKYRKGADAIADLPFPYTTLSLNTACDKNLKLMKQTKGCIAENGCIKFEIEEAQPVRFEQSFEGIKPVAKVVLKKRFSKELTLEFDGNSIVVEGSVVKTGHDESDYRAFIQAWLDGKLVEEFVMPYDYITRKYEVFSKYCFESGHHTLKFVLLNPHKDYEINAQSMLIYDKDE